MSILRRGLLLAFFLPFVAPGYSVLTHEAIIDSAWDIEIKPLLQAKYPEATADDLIKAHSYSYGGAIIQDLGYYPFGSHFFSDLTHYVRSGDFVMALLRNAQDLNEYAFALGSLAHYAADNDGHPIGVNRAVPLLYPKLRKKYGPVVTYEDAPAEHLRTEFGFDVLEVARGNFPSQAYHDFIGFHVAKELLERTIPDVYAIQMKDMFTSVDLALGTYRRSVSSIIPEMTKAAWAARKDEIRKSIPGITKRRFIYNLSRSSYEKEWDKQYEQPGCGARFLAALFRILPRIGPFKAFAFKMPTPEAEKFFMESFNRTLDRYRDLGRETRTGNLKLPNENMDTGKPVRPGDYRLADSAYEHLLEKLAEKKEPVPDDLKANILAFYGTATPVVSEKAVKELAALRAAGN